MLGSTSIRRANRFALCLFTLALKGLVGSTCAAVGTTLVATLVLGFSAAVATHHWKDVASVSEKLAANQNESRVTQSGIGALQSLIQTDSDKIDLILRNPDKPSASTGEANFKTWLKTADSDARRKVHQELATRVGESKGFLKDATRKLKKLAAEKVRLDAAFSGARSKWRKSAAWSAGAALVTLLSGYRAFRLVRRRKSN